MIKVFTNKTIENCPYTALVVYPPTEKHRNTFYKIMFIERGSAKLTLFDRNGTQKKKNFDIKAGDMFILSPKDVSLYENVSKNQEEYRHRYIRKRRINKRML